jgi:hypothetical protein
MVPVMARVVRSGVGNHFLAMLLNYLRPLYGLYTLIPLLVLIGWLMFPGLLFSADAPPINMGYVSVKILGGKSVDSYVAASVKKIKRENSKGLRVDYAQKLYQWVKDNKPSEISGADVDAMAELMSATDDGVRFWIASALGQLGGVARPAIPALQRALLERPCINGPMASASAIRLALVQIGAEPINAPCTDPFGQ